MKGEPTPRSSNFMGMRANPVMGHLGTWLEPEEITYPSGAMVRRARAINVDTGRLNVVKCGIAGTFFTIPVRGGGYIDASDGGIFRYNPPSRKRRSDGDKKEEEAKD